MTVKERVLWTLVSHMSTTIALYLVYRGQVDGVDVAMSMRVPDVGEPTFAFSCDGKGYGSEAELIAAVRERKGKKGLMRPIKFRGKPTATVWQDYTDETLFYEDEFVYGSLVVSGDDCYIVGDVIDCTEDSLELEWWVKVRPETVGQYTGLKADHDVEIYEGDIISVTWGNCGRGLFEVKYFGDIHYPAFDLEPSLPRGGLTNESKHGNGLLFAVNMLSVEVVGSIHDNPQGGVDDEG